MSTTPTTDYGSWNHFAGGSGDSPTADVLAYVNAAPEGIDVDATTERYVTAINAALPDGVSLNGREFYGTWPMPDDAREQIRQAIESVDMAECLVEQ